MFYDCYCAYRYSATTWKGDIWFWLSVTIMCCLSLRTDVTIYLVERSPNGTSKRIPATTLFSFLEQNNIKVQLTQLGVVMSVTRTELSPAQLKQLLQNAPAGEWLHACMFNLWSFIAWKIATENCCVLSIGVDPIIWEQAKVDNPDPER